MYGYAHKRFARLKMLAWLNNRPGWISVQTETYFDRRHLFQKICLGSRDKKRDSKETVRTQYIVTWWNEQPCRLYAKLDLPANKRQPASLSKWRSWLAFVCRGMRNNWGQMIIGFVENVNTRLFIFLYHSLFYICRLSLRIQLLDNSVTSCCQ